MIYKIYKCKDCGKTFVDPNFFEDEKGETQAVCPECNSYEYFEFDSHIEKSEVLLTLLQIICHANRLSESLKDMCGLFAQNDDLDEIFGIAEEFIEEMYDQFVTPRIANAVRHIRTENDVQKIILKLEGR